MKFSDLRKAVENHATDKYEGPNRREAVEALYRARAVLDSQRIHLRADLWAGQVWRTGRILNYDQRADPGEQATTIKKPPRLLRRISGLRARFDAVYSLWEAVRLVSTVLKA